MYYSDIVDCYDGETSLELLSIINPFKQTHLHHNQEYLVSRWTKKTGLSIPSPVEQFNCSTRNIHPSLRTSKVYL